MSRDAVKSLKGSFGYTCNLLDMFIEVCPENLWVEKFGGWPLWQSVYHTISSIDFFVRQEDEEPAKALYSHEVAGLSEVATGPAPTRQEIKELLPVMKAIADAYFDRLTDADLGEKNEGLSSRMPMPWTHASTCAMLSGHVLYHLGICDSALRERGMKGVF